MKKNELLEFKNTIVKLLSKENENYFLKKIDSIIKDSTECMDFYSRLLNLFVHHSFTEEEAKTHWQNIFDNYNKLKVLLNKDIGLHVSVFDYFIRDNKLFKEPLLVEIRLFKETENQAMRDALTGLFNRRYFDLSLKKELKRTGRNKKCFSIIILDIDDFKFINDEKGHWFGDEVIKSFSNIILSSAREEDTVSRYGGEEFFILLAETKGDGAVKFAERLKENIHISPFFMKNPMTFSAGISTYPYDGDKVDILIKYADKALYAAKYAGKNCIVKHSKENRRYSRFNRYFSFNFAPIERVFWDVNPPMEKTRDISMGGLRFETGTYFPISKKILINLNLSNNEDLTLISTVAWSREINKTLYSYGLRFSNISMDQVMKLAKHLPVK